jgi:hypothetical protein
MKESQLESMDLGSKREEEEGFPRDYVNYYFQVDLEIPINTSTIPDVF